MKLTELLIDLKVDFVAGGSHRHVRDGWIGVNCPFCSGSKYQLGIHERTHSVTCWRCGPHGFLETLTLLTGRSYGACKELLKEVRRPVFASQTQIKGNKVKIPPGIGPLQKAHVRYLERERGFDSVELMDIWKIAGIGIAARLAWHIWIPVYFQKQLVSWTSRSIGKSSSRYISASPTEERRSLKECLYGLDEAQNTILITEGPTDVWRGGKGVIATFGVNITRAQRTLMSRYANRVICFDTEPVAQQRARRLAADLSLFPGKTSVLEIDAPDLGSASQKEVSLIRRTVFKE